MLVFPFYKSFVGKENFNLTNELLAEVSGITQWAIEGLRRLRSNNGKFTEGKLGLIEKEEIRKDMFPLAEFIETACELCENQFTMLDDLYNAYRLWAATQGIKTPMTKSSFDKSLRNSSLPIKHDMKGHKGFHGVTVKSHMSMNSNVVGFPPIN
jgi:putative DNA primase/helicase